MVCETRVEERGWDVESRIQFTADGLINTVTSKRGGGGGCPVTMRAHYKRAADPWRKVRATVAIVGSWPGGGGPSMAK